MERIGFGRRLGAFCLDIVIVSVVSFFTGGTLGGLVGGMAGAMGAEADAATAAAGGALGAVVGMVAALMLVGTVYFLIEGFTGYTLGKYLLGIRVANADGTRASTGALLTRYAAKNVNFLLSLAAGLSGIAALSKIGGILGFVIFIGFFFVLGANRQGFHDMLAKTAVYPRDRVV